MTLAPAADADLQRLIAGMYARRFFVVLRTLRDPAAIAPNLKAHVEFLIGLERSGRLLASGPFPSGDGPPTGGLTIVDGTDVAEVTALMAEDPLLSSGAFSFTVHPWVLNEGRVTVQVTFSDRGFSFGT